MDFTYPGYRGMIQSFTAAGYTFHRFPQAQARLAAGAPFVLMRHDVDLDLEAAAALAQVEADLGMVSTYFVMVRTEFYNVFSQAGSAHVRAILDHGHDIGLHFDCATYPASADTAFLAAACAQEAHLLESWFGCQIETVSIHRPQPTVLAGDPALTAPLPHTYMDLFTKAIHYVADSRGEWRYGAPLHQAAFLQRRPMQILIHPIWWGEQAAPPLSTLHAFEARRARRLESCMAANSTIYRPPSLGPDPDVAANLNGHGPGHPVQRNRVISAAVPAPDFARSGERHD